MIDNNKHISEALFAKFLAGETEGDELMLVLDWIDHSEENRQAFETFERVWSVTGKKASFDADMAWNNVNKKITPATRNLFYIYTAAAAAIVMIIVFGLLLRNQSVQITNEFSVATLSEPVEEILPDGTEVMVAENSNLNYQYNKKTKTRIAQLSGEAFFDVKRDTNKRFIVNTGYGGVEVLGTSFNIDILENSDVMVDVRSGIVKVFLPEESKDTLFLIITKGESALISSSLGTIEKQIQQPSVFFAVDSTISFRNVELKMVFIELEKLYNVNIVADSSVYSGLRFSSSFKQNSIDEILTVVAETFNLRLRKVDNDYLFVNNEE